MPQYNKAEVGRIAQQFGFVRDTFEKVLRLKEILKYFNEQEYLKDHLLLKGTIYPQLPGSAIVWMRFVISIRILAVTGI